jgi:hypothetical protein
MGYPSACLWEVGKFTGLNFENLLPGVFPIGTCVIPDAEPALL